MAFSSLQYLFSSNPKPTKVLIKAATGSVMAFSGLIEIITSPLAFFIKIPSRLIMNLWMTPERTIRQSAGNTQQLCKEPADAIETTNASLGRLFCNARKLHKTYKTTYNNPKRNNSPTPPTGMPDTATETQSWKQTKHDFFYHKQDQLKKNVLGAYVRQFTV